MGFYFIRTASNWANQTQSVLGVSASEAKSNNALQIFSQLYTYGWTKNAIYGLLGNVQSEGLLNPGQYEIGYNYSTSRGFGLTQWTPATKVPDYAKTYAVARGYLTTEVANKLTFENESTSVCDGYVQCAIIAAEMATTGKYDPQYASTSRAPLNPIEYTHSTLDPGTLAKYWLHGYERPAKPGMTEPTRVKQAGDWMSFIENYGAAGIPMSGGTLPANFPPFTAPGGALPDPIPPDPSPEIPPNPNPPDPEPGTPVINKIYVQPTTQDANIGDRVTVRATGYGYVTTDAIDFIVDPQKLEILEVRNGRCTVLVKNGARGGAFIRAQWDYDPTIEQTVLINVPGGGLGAGNRKMWLYLKPLLR